MMAMKPYHLQPGLRLGFPCILIEQSEEYCELIVARLAEVNDGDFK